MAALERRRAAVRVVQPGGDAQPATAWQRWYGQYRQALALAFSLGIFAVLLGEMLIAFVGIILLVLMNLHGRPMPAALSCVCSLLPSMSPDTKQSI